MGAWAQECAFNLPQSYKSFQSINQSSMHLRECSELITPTGSGCSHGNIRLRGCGASSYGGRVEVCLHGVWGTVCDDSWTTVDSNIACRQLGFSNSGESSNKLL